MSVRELLERLNTLPQGATLDWRKIREDIHDEYEHATTTTDRVALLSIFKATMDAVERSGVIAPEEMEKFRETRLKDYHLLILREVLVGENVCVEMLDEVTQREVAAGRMATDDNLRRNALYSMMAPHLSRPELMARDAEKRGLPLSTRSPRVTVSQRALAWTGRAKTWPVAEKLLSWFRANVIVHLLGRGQIVQYGREAVRSYWSANSDVTKGFPQEFVKNEARDMMEEVVKVATSPDPRMANRKQLAERVQGWAQFQVLTLDRQASEDPTGLRGQPGITGELKEHLLELTEKDDDLRQFVQRVGPVRNWDDAWNAVVARSYVMYAWAHVFHMLRLAFDDMNPGTDWFKPFVAATCAWQEHQYRGALGLRPSLAESDTDADLRSLAMSGFESCVTEGFRDPDVEWHRRLEQVEYATKPTSR